MSLPKDPAPLILPLWVRRQAHKKLEAEGLSSDQVESYLNECSTNMGFAGVMYSLPMPASAGLLITRLRQSLPSLRVDQGSYKNYKHAVQERWWRLETAPQSHFSVTAESRSCESVPDDPPHTILKFELSVPFTRRQLLGKLTSSLRSLRTSARSSTTQESGQSQSTEPSTLQDWLVQYYKNSLNEQTWKRSQ